MKQHAPIKRHPSLAAISGDHHFGLLLVWKIGEGLRNNISPARISKYVLFFFEKDLELHFREEEEWLFNKLPADDELRKMAETDHRTLRELAATIRQHPDDEVLLKAFADTLRHHIRFEERTLFNHLQETLDTSVLEQAAIHARNHGPALDALWKDDFWKKQ